MKQTCTHCDGKLTRHDSYRRAGQRKLTWRYRCLSCGRTQTESKGNWDHGLQKRELADQIFALSGEGNSERGIARILGIDPKTVARYKKRLAIRSKQEINQFKEENSESFSTVFLDEAITFEHTRCKPLAVSVATSADCHMLGFSVAEMPAIGKHLKQISVEKYGPRKNRRRAGVRKTLKDASPMIAKNPKVVTDEEVSYGPLIRKQFGEGVEHTTHKAIRSSVAGQGEMKTNSFDPLFPVNHSLARMRDGVSSMVRKTWATAKRVWSLINHLFIFMAYHNRRVVSQLEKKRRKTQA
jgi:transposase-like protein